MFNQLPMALTLIQTRIDNAKRDQKQAIEEHCWNRASHLESMLDGLQVAKNIVEGLQNERRQN